MSNYNKNTGYGQLQAILAQNGVSSFGKVLVVVEDSDTANYQRLQDIFNVDQDGVVRFYSTLNAAYDAATTNAGDVILMSANSTHTITPIAWSKNRINVIGLDGGDRLVQQGTKVQNSSDDDEAYLIKVTGVRNSFRNIKFIQASEEDTALNVLQEGGEGNLYKNCSFIFGVADNLDETTASEVLAGSDSATFRECTFGSDVLLTSAARSVFLIDQVTASQEFKSNIVKDCNFIIQSSEADAQFIFMAAAGDVKFTNLFDGCSFQATINGTNSAIALTRAVSTANGLVEGSLHFASPKVFNCTDFGTNGTNNDNLKVVAPLAVVTDIVAVAPIAT
jgi:hypothetical protein